MENGNKPIHPTETVKEPWLKKQHQTVEKEPGLTKREYFAGLAMQGILANPQLTSISEEKVVETAIFCAEELLKQLEIKK